MSPTFTGYSSAARSSPRIEAMMMWSRSCSPPRWTWSSVSSSPRGCGALVALLSAGRWPAHAAAAARPRRLALRVRVPDGVAVVVGGTDLQQAIPDLGASQLLLRGGPVDRAL